MSCFPKCGYAVRRDIVSEDKGLDYGREKKAMGVILKRSSKRNSKRGILLYLSMGFILLVVAFTLQIFVGRQPIVNGTLNLPILEKSVKVVRDQWGVPHITAQSELDVYRALGFVAAQDRLFQMDVHRRLANGELSEVLGSEALKFDKMFRTLRLKRSQNELLLEKKSLMNSKMLELIQAYLNGLNYYIDHVDRLPAEFAFLHYRPKHFELAEVLAFPGFMAFSFAEALRGDALFGALKGKISHERLEQLRAGFEEGGPIIAGDSSSPEDQSSERKSSGEKYSGGRRGRQRCGGGHRSGITIRQHCVCKLPP